MKNLTATYMQHTLPLDQEGSPISAVRLDPKKLYQTIPTLLQAYINDKDTTAWEQITHQIDTIYDHLDLALLPLNDKTHCFKQIKTQIDSGKKLFFKLNLVLPLTIDPETHGAGPHLILTTEWPFLAAVMRWFHDRLSIHYHQMAVGDAATTTSLFSSQFTKMSKLSITPEALVEGKSGDFYGGWGFYFVRHYLNNHHSPLHTDCPMNGYEDSLSGKFLPPGKADNKLMVYDLNKIQDAPSRGRTVPVPNGENFSEVTLHKVIIGGDPKDPSDQKNYPGCVLINLPKPKLHEEDMMTNAIKNLGIGLYPNECASSPFLPIHDWKYAHPSTSTPSLKSKLPHSKWLYEIDEKTYLPKKDSEGHYILKKTKGLLGTQLDILSVLKALNIYTLHIADGLYVINLSHCDANAIRIPEGYIWCSEDPVALDLCCARYCFKTLPMHQAAKLKALNNWPTEFVHTIPIPKLKGCEIESEVGYDSPLFRYPLFKLAEEKGLGTTKYHILGSDALNKCPLVSINGHLGYLKKHTFKDLITQTLYYNLTSFIHHLQPTCLQYAKCHDQVMHTSLYEEIMDLFDENKDGIIDYAETGRGMNTQNYVTLAFLNNLALEEENGDLKRDFLFNSFYAQFSCPEWNAQAHDFTKEWYLAMLLHLAYDLSCKKEMIADSFIPHMHYGSGYWPSFLTVKRPHLLNTLYGSTKRTDISLSSMYGCAFKYADIILNNGLYTKDQDQTLDRQSRFINYLAALDSGAPYLDFTLYTPPGYGYLEGIPMPNVIETNDPSLIFTAEFINNLNQTTTWAF